MKYTIFGESHGPAIGVVLEGVPAGLELNAEEIQRQLDRRAPGKSELSTARKESDLVHIISGFFHDPAHGITPGSASCMTKMQRAGGIGRYILKIHADAIGSTVAVIGFFPKDLTDRCRKRILCHGEIQKSRSCDFHGLNPVLLPVHSLCQCFGNLPRVPAQDTCQLHRCIRRKISVFPASRCLNDNLVCRLVQVKCLLQGLTDRISEFCIR